MIDFHTHSSASDGTYSPAELMGKAHELGIATIALTDHDCIDGLAEAARTAAGLGLRFIQGVEIEIAFGPGEFHLLGLDLRIDLNKPDAVLVSALAELAQARENRNREMVERFIQQGYPLDYAELRAMYGSGSLGRPHIAEYLVKKGIVRNKQLAFDQFLAKGKPFFIQKDCFPLDRAIELIHKAGGLAFVAHPMSLFVSWTRMRELLPAWKELGLDGVEAWHPLARIVDCERLQKLAGELALRVSAGSDYHGPIRPDRQLGRTAGKRWMEDHFLSAIER
ncbi:MAG: PHP domain-containing protein [Spirochaetes bacterium]|nr:PHP domain-containing protein [Spirochaetota bacterium]MBU0956075.1 PHP domain-containing protein [Spirochaetota bacterium]